MDDQGGSEPGGEACRQERATARKNILVVTRFTLFHMHNLSHEISVGSHSQSDNRAQDGALEEGLILPLLQHVPPHLDRLDIFVLRLLRVLILQNLYLDADKHDSCACEREVGRISGLTQSACISGSFQ